ncbi:unnamed protein product, partial [Rotaria sp. Silwood2]
LSLILTNEPQIRHQIEQLIQIRNKIKEQFNLTIQQFEELVQRFNISLNEHNSLEKRLTTTLCDIERCLNLTGDNFTSQTRQYLNVKITQKKNNNNKNEFVKLKKKKILLLIVQVYRSMFVLNHFEYQLMLK